MKLRLNALDVVVFPALDKDKRQALRDAFSLLGDVGKSQCFITNLIITLDKDIC